MSYEEPIIISILNNDVMLDRECWCCDRGNKEPDESFCDENEVCDQCNGTGFILTDLGEGILKFLKRHSKE